MCSKMNYKDHVQDTSSWPIRSHACVCAWTFIWRLKVKMTAWKDPESFPEKRCACALSGRQSQQSGHSLFTPVNRFSTLLTSLSLFQGPKSPEAIQVQPSPGLLQSPLTLLSTVLDISYSRLHLWPFDTQCLFLSLYNSLEIKKNNIF